MIFEVNVKNEMEKKELDVKNVMEKKEEHTSGLGFWYFELECMGAYCPLLLTPEEGLGDPSGTSFKYLL